MSTGILLLSSMGAGFGYYLTSHLLQETMDYVEFSCSFAKPYGYVALRCTVFSYILSKQGSLQYVLLLRKSSAQRPGLPYNGSSN